MNYANSCNNEALEDAYIRGLPNSILQKVFAQVTLPKGLDIWKMVIQNLDCLHRDLVELKCSTGQMNPAAGHTSQVTSWPPQVTAATSQSTHVTVNPQTLDSITPMDVDLQKSQLETHKCYNCQKIGHLAHNCPEPHRQHTWNNISEVDISDLVTKAVNATLDAQETKGKAKEEAKADF